MRTITEDELRQAVEGAGLEPMIFDRIRAALPDKKDHAANFEAAHISYYMGGLLIIGAMGWFVTSAWDKLGGGVLFCIALLYAGIFGGIGLKLSKHANTRVPGGVLMTVAVCMTPLAVYGIERQMGWWPASDPGGYGRFHPYINASWIAMEIATIVAAIVGVRLVRFAFVMAPAAYSLWYLSMDATAMIFGRTWNFREECWISAAFGLAMLVAGFVLDRKSEIDLSFWFYLFGLLAFTGGLTLLGDGGQLGKAVYCLVHLVLIGLSVVLQRRAFLVFGAIGVFAYLIGEAHGYFRDSLGFTIALTLVGVLFLAAGIVYKRKEEDVAIYFARYVPLRVKQRTA